MAADTLTVKLLIYWVQLFKARPGEGGYSHILAIWVCAAGEGIVFKPFGLVMGMVFKPFGLV